jgi:hypothetical protein
LLDLLCNPKEKDVIHSLHSASRPHKPVVPPPANSATDAPQGKDMQHPVEGSSLASVELDRGAVRALPVHPDHSWKPARSPQLHCPPDERIGRTNSLAGCNGSSELPLATALSPAAAEGCFAGFCPMFEARSIWRFLSFAARWFLTSAFLISMMAPVSVACVKGARLERSVKSWRRERMILN